MVLIMGDPGQSGIAAEPGPASRAARPAPDGAVPGAAGGRRTGPAAPRADWLPRSAPWLSGLVTLVVTLWRIQKPSYWRDEGATLSAVHRSFPQLLRLLDRMDAVHGTYYVLMWPWVRLAGSGELAVRLPSAVAMAIAAAVVTVLGRRLVSAGAGLAAGLAFAAIPAVSWFGQDARPFALETAAAAVASYCLVRLLNGDRLRRRAAWYAISLVAVGLANVFGLLLVPAHAITVAAGRRRSPAVRRYWLAAVAVAGVLLTPLAAAAWLQRGQVGWVRTPLLGAVMATERLVGSRGVCLAAAVVIGTGLALSLLRGRARLRADWPGPLAALCLPWLLLPAGLLIAVSWVHPLYTFRYIVFCIPAAALLIGAGLAAAGRVAGPVALALLVVLALPAQLGERGPAGHSDNIRAIDHILARNARPGDAAIYPQGPGMLSFAAAYPYGLARLRDLMVAQSPVASSTTSGTDATPSVIRGRLAHVSRVWVAEADKPLPGPPALLQGLPFHLVRKWGVSDIWLWLYVRRP
jgi:mannosyltransferase